MVEHTAVNRGVVGSSPTRGVSLIKLGPMVKRLRHRPFTAVTAVRICLGSSLATWPSGKARVCKTLIPGSIPGVASKEAENSQLPFLFRFLGQTI